VVDVNRVTQSVVKSGRAFYGVNQSANAVEAGRAVALIISDNCPEETRKELEKHATLSSIPIIDYPGSSRDLGIACRKPFAVSVLAVREIPEADLALEVRELMEKEG